MYVYVCIRMYTYVYVCMYCMYVCMYVRVQCGVAPIESKMRLQNQCLCVHRHQRHPRRTSPVPQHNFGEMYYDPTRRTVHLFRNCVGLASVRPRDIITEQLCLNCWGGMII